MFYYYAILVNINIFLENYWLKLGFLFSFLLGIPLTISNRVRNLLSWVSEFQVSNYFTMALRNGCKMSHETIIIDDDDDDDIIDDEIQEVGTHI